MICASGEYDFRALFVEQYVCAYRIEEETVYIYHFADAPKIIFIISLGWSNWQHDLLSTMPITRVRQSHFAGRQAHRRRDPCAGQRPGLGIWHLY